MVQRSVHTHTSSANVLPQPQSNDASKQKCAHMPTHSPGMPAVRRECTLYTSICSAVELKDIHVNGQHRPLLSCIDTSKNISQASLNHSHTTHTIASCAITVVMEKEEPRLLRGVRNTAQIAPWQLRTTHFQAQSIQIGCHNVHTHGTPRSVRDGEPHQLTWVYAKPMNEKHLCTTW